MGEAVDVGSLEWQVVRPDVARGVLGKSVLAGGFKVVLTRVTPGGAFTTHEDGYGHLFYFLAGEGRARVEDRTYDVKANVVVTVPAGAPHSYENTGAEDLLLISMNLPPTAPAR